MQRVAYVGVIAVVTVIILSGLAIWKPVQFQELAALMGGYEARGSCIFSACGPSWCLS